MVVYPLGIKGKKLLLAGAITPSAANGIYKEYGTAKNTISPNITLHPISYKHETENYYLMPFYDSGFLYYALLDTGDWNTYSNYYFEQTGLTYDGPTGKYTASDGTGTPIVTTILDGTIGQAELTTTYIDKAYIDKNNEAADTS